MPAKTEKKRTPPKVKQVNFWGMLQNIIIVAINKGQLPILGVILIFLVLIIKIPKEDASVIIKEFIHLVESFHILGWIFSVFLLIALFYTAKTLKRKHQDEIDRLAKEKKELQEILNGTPLNTTKKERS
jgi:Na+/melibiose symporter-like transporter